MDDESVLNSVEHAAAADHDQNFISSQPIPFAIRNWVFGIALSVIFILIQISYQDNKGALFLFDQVHRLSMEFMISAFILLLWASVAERIISCFGERLCCLTTASWKRLFGHIADLLSSFTIGLLISVLPSSLKVAKYIAYMVCASPTIRLFIIFLVIPLVDFIIYKQYCCFGGDDNGGVTGVGNNGEGGVGDAGVGGDDDGVGGSEYGDAVDIGEDDEDVGVGDDNNSSGIQMSSLD